MSRVPYNPVAPPSPDPHGRSPYGEQSFDNNSYYDERDEAFVPPAGDLPHGAAPGQYAPGTHFRGLVGQEPGFRGSYASASQASFTTGQAGADYDSVRGLNYTSQPQNIPQRGLGSPLLPPDPYRDDPYHSQQNAGGIPMSPVGSGFREFPEKREQYASPREKSKRTAWFWIGILIAIIIAIAAVAIPVYVFVIKKNDGSSSSSTGSSGSGSSGTGSSGSGSTGKGGTKDAAITGGDQSIVTTDNGTTFVYNNTFGGFWYWDPKDPFNNNAQAQSWVPPLNTSWDFNNDRIRGVNLGGWLNTEPFISPALYDPYYPNAVDEYTLSQYLRNDTAGGGIQQQLTNHYDTFITEIDFAQIAAAGLSWVRLPIPFWAIETWEGEPFLEGVGWTYFLKAVKWARKYGLRINLDFHAVPGSQNGWNHSGRLGQPNFLYGVMGLANADRTLDYLRILIEFISQPQYKDVVPFFGVLNEALTSDIGTYPLYSYYLKVHDMVRGITGFGEGNGPVLSLHDGFVGGGPWAGLFPGSDRLAVDIHPYLAFAQQSNAPMQQQAARACQTWASGTNSTMGTFGIIAAGEFSNAINDCGLYVNGVGIGTRWEDTFPGWTIPALGNCSAFTQWETWDDTTKQGIKLFALASMDALVHWFFWTWKIGPSTRLGHIDAPVWSYSLGLQEGWMPTDPREAEGVCSSLGVASTPAPALPATATGSGGGTISASFSTSYSAWPVTSLASIPNVSLLPRYTPTGTVTTLPVPTFTTPGSTQTFDAGSGWFDANDNTPANVPISGCTYPDEYIGNSGALVLPTSVCVGAKKRTAAPEPTAPPS